MMASASQFLHNGLHVNLSQGTGAYHCNAGFVGAGYKAGSNALDVYKRQLVYLPNHVTSTVPVGPLRCLAMFISQMFGLSVSGL